MVFILSKLTCPQATLICNLQPVDERSPHNLGMKLLPGGQGEVVGGSPRSQGRGHQ